MQERRFVLHTWSNPLPFVTQRFLRNWLFRIITSCADVWCLRFSHISYKFIPVVSNTSALCYFLVSSAEVRSWSNRQICPSACHEGILGSKIAAPLFLNGRNRWSWVVSFTHRRPWPGKILWCRRNRKLAPDPPCSVFWEANISWLFRERLFYFVIRSLK